MRRFRKLTLAAMLLGFATLSTGCDRTTGALLVGGAIIATALIVDDHDDHRHHHGYHHGYHHGHHYSHHSSHHYDHDYHYCD
ncbi:MAG: hypothetical protein AAGA29_02205 [Planctomycetota bacterium]